MAVNSIVRARIDERTKKQAAAAWLRVDATRIAQALDEGVLGFTLASEFRPQPKPRQAEGERVGVKFGP